VVRVRSDERPRAFLVRRVSLNDSVG
jgi:hypothetical protein